MSYAPLPTAPAEGKTYGVKVVGGQFHWVETSTTPTTPSTGTVDSAVVGTPLSLPEGGPLMAQYTPNAGATGDVVTKTKLDRPEAGAAAGIPKADADNAYPPAAVALANSPQAITAKSAGSNSVATI